MASHMKTPSQEEGSKSTDSPRLSTGKKVAIVTAGALVVLAAGAYCGGASYFGSTFLPGTTLNGKDVSLKTVDEVAAELQGELGGYSLHVTGNGVDLTISAADVSLACDAETAAAEALSQTSPWAWPLEVTGTRDLSVETTLSFDRDALVALIAPFVDASAQKAAAAGSDGIHFDAEQGVFALDDALVPYHLNLDLVVDKVSAAFDERAESLELGDDCLEEGSALQDAVNQANVFVAAATTLTLGGQHAYVVTPEKIAEWVVINDDLTASLDTDAILAWCKGELSDLLDSYGSERTYTRPDGVTCTVNDGTRRFGTSTYGWITDGTALSELLVAAIEAGQPSTIDIPTKQSAVTVNPGGQDWGDRYIDVDLTRQHAIFFDGGTVIWEADITSGQPNLNRETPTGVWKVTSRQSGDINLRGPIDPETGEPEWDSHVQFWVGVVGSEVGFHNAPWQSVFGGQIYTWNGSHGCIRLDYGDAQALYGVVSVGDVVVIHN